MRDFLDEILSFVGADSLTDEEFEALTIGDEELTVATYAALKGVLEARESVSDTLYRLAFYYLAAGVTVATVNTSIPAVAGETVHEPTSQVLIGCVL